VKSEREKRNKTSDLRIEAYLPLVAPDILTGDLPLSGRARATVLAGRERIGRIISKEENRLLVIAGPCSIDNEESALEYAARLVELSRKVDETLLVVMRVYFEKPRTTTGWKGLINDPDLDGSCKVEDGLRKARSILLKINEMGMPAATEMLEPVTPQYVADLVSWASIGARTTESQTHRQMASGLSMPVGFKNGTDGNLCTPVNAMLAARTPQSFLGIDSTGRTCVVKTRGNELSHLVLRGGERPNYDPISIEEARLKLIEKGLPQAIVIDCSHANSMKMYQGQANVWHSVLDQRIAGNDAIAGMMLESHLLEGNQKFNGDRRKLKYGVSITDACISWPATEALLLEAHEKILAVCPG